MKWITTLKRFYLKHIYVWLALSGVAAALNFGSFMIIAMNIGGDAINGTFEAGHYFVANHGVLTEVSRRVWIYSYVHSISVIITFGFLFLNAWLQRFAKNEGDAS